MGIKQHLVALAGIKEKSCLSTLLAAQNRTFFFCQEYPDKRQIIIELDPIGLRSCLLHQLHQLPEAVHHIVFDVLRGVLPIDLVEKLPCTFDFGSLNRTQIH